MLQTTCANAIGSFFIFLHLLERQAECFGECAALSPHVGQLGVRSRCGSGCSDPPSVFPSTLPSDLAALAAARVNADDIERVVVEVLGRELSRPEFSANGRLAGGSTETSILVRDTSGLRVKLVGAFFPPSQGCAMEPIRYAPHAAIEVGDGILRGGPNRFIEVNQGAIVFLLFVSSRGC
jgi:hypothetical protein